MAPGDSVDPSFRYEGERLSRGCRRFSRLLTAGMELSAWLLSGRNRVFVMQAAFRVGARSLCSAQAK